MPFFFPFLSSKHTRKCPIEEFPSQTWTVAGVTALRCFCLLCISSKHRQRMPPWWVLRQCDVMLLPLLPPLLFTTPCLLPTIPPSLSGSRTEDSAMSFCVASAQEPSRLCQQCEATGRESLFTAFRDEWGIWKRDSIRGRNEGTGRNSRSVCTPAVAHHVEHYGEKAVGGAKDLLSVCQIQPSFVCHPHRAWHKPN